jgi:hypothetical protein
MENEQFPPELEQLERDLADRPRLDPPAELRERVIDGVRAELQRNGARNGWTFAAAVAAAALVWANLSLSATLGTDYSPQPGSLRPPVDEVAEQIQQLLPELSQREALRQAVLLQARSDLLLYPHVSAGPAASRRLGDLDDLLPQGK